MSVYREPARRRARAAAVAALIGVVGGGVGGFIVGRTTADEPTLVQRLAELEQRLRPALSALELVQIEYPEAVRGGRVVAETEYRAADSQAESASATVESNREELVLLSPRETRAAERSLARLRRLIRDSAAPRAVTRMAGAAARAVEAAANAPDAR